MRLKRVIRAQKGLLVCETDDGKIVHRTNGSVSWRTNNPGNLKEGKFTRSFGSIGKDHIGHAVFPTYDHGHLAKYNLLFSQSSVYYNLNLIETIYRYAPTSDGNKPDQYIGFLVNQTQINKHEKLSELSEQQRQDLLQAMEVFEGYKVGNDIFKEG